MSNCLVCGKPKHGYFPLCNDCFKLRDEGKIRKCESCNTWHYSNKPCQCVKEQPILKETKSLNIDEPIKNKTNIITVDAEKPLTECIICKEESNGHLFCKNCFYKYNKKILLIKISKCTEIELMDDSYEGKYTCSDGHIVKSKSEMAIDNYLYKENIKHAYEKGFPIDDKEEHDLHPDFYLPNYFEQEIYIEHWGYDESNLKYTERKEYKLEHYKKLKINLISTEEKDMIDIDTALKRKLMQYKK